MSNQIVYVATHAWGSPIRVGSHHFAREIAKKNNVLYLSHPISLRSFFSRADNQLSIRLHLWKTGMSEVAGEKNMREASWLMPFAPSPKSSNSTAIHALRWRLCSPNPKKIFSDSGFSQPDVLWLDSFFQNYWVSMLQPKKLIMRVADHPLHITRMSKAAQRCFEQSLEQAEQVVTPTPSIAEYLCKITTSPVTIIPNGVDVAQFNRELKIPTEYESDPNPKVVFVGALANWIDFDLVKHCAALCKGVSFYLIGPNHKQDLTNLPLNLKVIGSRPHSDIPGYLRHAQVAIAPFDVLGQKTFIESIDAIKLYEYIAAGVPTVATKWRQSESLAPYVITAEQRADSFASAILEAIRNPSSHIAPESFRYELDWSRRLKPLNL